MMRPLLGMTSAALLACTNGCGLCLAQTAKTEPEGHGTVAFGAGAFVSETDDERGGFGPQNALTELSGRVGVASDVDVGVASYLGIGVLVDAKVSLLDQRRREAIAVRFGGGAAYTLDSSVDTVAQVGLLASYDVTRSFVPYAGIVWSNHWVFGESPAVPLSQNAQYASWKGYGDGIFELHFGIALLSDVRRRGVYVEYALWLPMQDDPGDSFKFARTHLGEIVVRL